MQPTTTEDAMRNLPNIEKSAFGPGDYIGYGVGVWRITKTTSSYGNWIAYKQNAQLCDRPIYAFTLKQMSDKLTNLLA